jgi:DNA topoisomerase-1
MNKKVYCFDIGNPDNVDFDPTALKQYVKTLYMGRGKDTFTKGDPPPFIVTFHRDDDDVCIRLTSVGKKNIERIENINKKIPTKKLHWHGLVLGKPHEWGVAQQSWWDAENEKKKGGRWVSIVQRGPYFTHIEEPYKLIGGKLMYNGRMYKLTPEEEKVAVLYAKRLASEESGGVVDRLTKQGVFNDNFWMDFKTYLTPEHKKIFKDFERIGWRDFTRKVEKMKETNPTEAEKRLKLVHNEEKKRKYGYAKLDGNLEQVGNFTVEPVGIFMGRGKNPLRGRIKREVNPEDVTINVGEEDPVPVPPAGHKWGKITHDHKVIWLAKWKDSITHGPKYVQFAATGRFKGESDLTKYEKARKLQRHIAPIRKAYMKDADSTNDEKMQLGTVLWLIDHHGIRPGDERGEDQADTVGASTLRVDHVKLLPGDKIKFEFLGKDSIKFEKSMRVPPLIYRNFDKLLSGRAQSSQVFNMISASSINIYLKQFDVDFSNKVFRTRLASHIMFEALKTVSVPKDANKKQTKISFNKANVKVADVLNHTRSISVKAKAALKNLKTQLKELKAKLKDTKSEGKSEKAIASLQKRIKTKKESIEAKEDTKSVAINTSLTNYIDPRLVVAWAKGQGLKGKQSEAAERTSKILKDVYSSTMLKKFQWAIQSSYVTKDWNWLTSPLQGSPGLQPGQPRPGRPSAGPKRPSGPTVVSKELRTWCREKYGSNWYKVDKVERLQEARLALSKTGTPPPPPSLAPASIKDYKILLDVCRTRFRKKKEIVKLSKVRTKKGYIYPALEWLHPFTVYATEENKGNVVLSREFNSLYALINQRGAPIVHQPRRSRLCSSSLQYSG